MTTSMSASGRFCCKSLKTPDDKFPARRPNKPRSLIDVASGSSPKSPVSLSPGDEVPHMFTRKPRLQLEKFAINGAKRLLQQNRHGAYRFLPVTTALESTPSQRVGQSRCYAKLTAPRRTATSSVRPVHPLFCRTGPPALGRYVRAS